MTDRPSYGDPDEWRANRERWYVVNERRLKNMGQFEALLSLPSVERNGVRDWKQVVEYVQVHEFELAFSLITAIVAQNNPQLSDDAYALLEKIAERLKVKPDDWHGLKRG
jgi:hypothetical protein